MKRVILYITITACVIGLIIGGTKFAHASEQNEALLTWQAQNFYPSNYPGKGSATPNSQIIVSATTIQNGKIIYLPSAEYTWYVDGRLFNRDVGLSDILFRPSKLAGGSHSVRVIVKTSEYEEWFKGTITVPVTNYKVVVEAPFPYGLLYRASQATLRAIPYFFGVESFDRLGFNWSMNDERKPDETGGSLVVNIGNSMELVGMSVSFGVTVVNNKDPLESAQERIMLTIK